LDEPTAGVDPEGRLVVRDVVASLRARQAAVLLTTHELAEAERMADRVVIVDGGREVAEGTPAGLASAGGGAGEVSFGTGAGLDVAALSAALGSPVAEESPGRYRVAAGASPRLTAALTAWLAERELSLTDLRVGRTLEEVYLSVVGTAATTSAPGPRPLGRGTHRLGPAVTAGNGRRGRRR
jgi:ABC-2 type transport system ATP-binding protein